MCGPSGSGKSTMIRCINRLEAHQEGRIVVDGTELTDDTRALDTIRREVGMVFQSFNLFPHLTILENCTLAPIWVRKMPKAEAEELAMSFLTPGADPRAGEEISRPVVGRAAAARGDRPRAVHAAEDHAVRRADLGARSGDDQGSAGRDDRAGRVRHDHGLRDARDGVRAPGRGPGGVHGPRRDRRKRHAARDVREPADRPAEAVPVARFCGGTDLRPGPRRLWPFRPPGVTTRANPGGRPLP